MKRKVSRQLFVMSLVAGLICGGLKMDVSAEGEKHFCITYRAGNVGEFKDDVYMQNHEDVTVIAHSSKYITFAVAEGSAYPVLPSQINGELKVSDPYLVLTWGPEKSKVTTSEEYVVDYGKMIHPVGFEVIYLNQKDEILDTYHGKGDCGEVVELAKLIKGFQVAKGEKTSFTLDGDESKNKFVIHYVEETIANESNVQYVQKEGTTTTVYEEQTETVTLPGDVIHIPASNGAGQGEQAMTVSGAAKSGQDVGGTAGALQGNNRAEASGSANDNSGIYEGGEQSVEYIEILDESVPVSDALEDENQKEESKESGIAKTSPHYPEVPENVIGEFIREYFPIITIVACVILIGCITRAVVVSRKHGKHKDSTKSSNKKKKK